MCIKAVYQVIGLQLPNGTKINTSWLMWLITASRDTLMQTAPYITMMKSTALRSADEKI